MITGALHPPFDPPKNHAQGPCWSAVALCWRDPWQQRRVFFFGRKRWTMCVVKPQSTLWLCQNSYWKWPSRNSACTHKKWWFSIGMLVYQRVIGSWLSGMASSGHKRFTFVSNYWSTGHSTEDISLSIPDQKVPRNLSRRSRPICCIWTLQWTALWHWQSWGAPFSNASGFLGFFYWDGSKPWSLVNIIFCW